jgi:predicted TIM-barrel fold metal-dependent hydrolase
VDRYTVISADGHAGADLYGYRPYLASRWHDDFDAWASSFVNPWGDLNGPVAYRNWDSDRRLAELEADGIVAEILFPNTIPPFFPSANLLARPPAADEYERRWAGVQAHNRWLADFCAAAPGRRAGIAQIFLNDVDAAVKEIRWAAEVGLTGGVLLPGVEPNSPLPPLWSDAYEPVWSVCAELDVTLNSHGGAGLPAFGMDPVSRAVMLIELPIYAHRSLWHLIFGGVFERYANLRFAMTEQGTGWIPGGLSSLDWFRRRMLIETAPESRFGGEAAAKLSLTPSEYFARNCYVGASFMRPIECSKRHEIGVDRIMWGSDYPHSEGSYPHTREVLRHSFADVSVDETRRMLSGTAAEVYGFDLAALDALAAAVGPTVAEVHVPLELVPADSTCNAFDEDAIVRAW